MGKTKSSDWKNKLRYRPYSCRGSSQDYITRVKNQSYSRTTLQGNHSQSSSDGYRSGLRKGQKYRTKRGPIFTVKDDASDNNWVPQKNCLIATMVDTRKFLFCCFYCQSSVVFFHRRFFFPT